MFSYEKYQESANYIKEKIGVLEKEKSLRQFILLFL